MDLTISKSKNNIQASKSKQILIYLKYLGPFKCYVSTKVVCFAYLLFKWPLIWIKSTHVRVTNLFNTIRFAQSLHKSLNLISSCFCGFILVFCCHTVIMYPFTVIKKRIFHFKSKSDHVCHKMLKVKAKSATYRI